MVPIDSLQLEVLAFLAMLVATAVVIRGRTIRERLGWAATAAVKWARTSSAFVTRLFDAATPVNDRNGKLPRLRFGVWIALNLATVTAWIAAIESEQPSHTITAIVAAAALLTLVNLTLLGGAYWALREGIDIMNADQPYRRRKFSDLSVARSTTFVFTSAVVAITEIAVLLEWAQENLGVEFIRVQQSIGLAYADFLAATVNALPFAAFYVALPGLSAHATATPGVGVWCFKALNTFGSVLIVGTAIGFAQRHIAFKKMIDVLVNAPDSSFKEILKGRFVRAPAAIKRYVRAAFQSETDDRKRVTLVDLAVAKHAYSFPATYVRSYSRLPEAVRAEATPIIAEFIEQKGHQFSIETLVEIVTATSRAVAGGTLATADQQRLACVFVSTVERLSIIAHGPGSTRAALAAMRSGPGQKLLFSLLMNEFDSAWQRRSVDLLIRANSHQAIPVLLRSLQFLDQRAHIAALAWSRDKLADQGTQLSPGTKAAFLSEIEHAVKFNESRGSLAPGAMAILGEIKRAVATRRQSPRDQPRKPGKPVGGVPLRRLG